MGAPTKVRFRLVEVVLRIRSDPGKEKEGRKERGSVWRGETRRKTRERDEKRSEHSQA